MCEKKCEKNCDREVCYKDDIDMMYVQDRVNRYISVITRGAAIYSMKGKLKHAVVAALESLNYDVMLTDKPLVENVDVKEIDNKMKVFINGETLVDWIKMKNAIG